MARKADAKLVTQGGPSEDLRPAVLHRVLLQEGNNGNDFVSSEAIKDSEQNITKCVTTANDAYWNAHQGVTKRDSDKYHRGNKGLCKNL